MAIDNNFNFRFIANYDASQIEKTLESLDKVAWNLFKYRQQNIIGHQDTLTIPIIFNELKEAKRQSLKFFKKFEEPLLELSEYLKSIEQDNKICRANIVLLFANKSIGKHRDGIGLLQLTRRFHIPLKTNSQCIFQVDDELMHIPKGQIWEINNTGKYHSVENKGESDRIHLVVDVRPNRDGIINS